MHVCKQLAPFSHSCVRQNIFDQFLAQKRVLRESLDFVEYQKRIKLLIALLTVILFIAVVVLEASLRFVAISHNCTFNTTDFIAHKIAVHSNQSEFSLRILDH